MFKIPMEYYAIKCDDAKRQTSKCVEDVLRRMVLWVSEWVSVCNFMSLSIIFVLLLLLLAFGTRKAQSMIHDWPFSYMGEQKALAKWYVIGAYDFTACWMYLILHNSQFSPNWVQKTTWTLG